MLHGIDVSYANGVIDWAKVKAYGGVDFVMIRATYGWDNPKQVDKQFANNVAGCEAVGIPYGFYHYSYATTPEEAVKEANFFYSYIKNYHPTYPVVLDIEEPKIVNNKSATALCDIATAFLSRLEELGYYAMFYTSSSIVNYKLAALSKYDLWVANWNVAKPNVNRAYGIWQYSAKGSVPGINNNVDMNYAYRDYVTIINNMHAQTAPDNSSELDVLKERFNALQSNYDNLRSSIAEVLQRYS